MHAALSPFSSIHENSMHKLYVLNSLELGITFKFTSTDVRYPQLLILILVYVIYSIPPYTQVTHGGLFKDDDVLLDDIRKVDRDRQPPEDGIHLIWLVNMNASNLSCLLQV